MPFSTLAVAKKAPGLRKGYFSEATLVAGFN